MKISKGPMLESYALLIDETIENVVQHVNDCVNIGWDGSPKTEKERLEHVKAYITKRIDDSITAHIKADLARKAA